MNSDPKGTKMDIRTAHKAARIHRDDGRTFASAGRDYLRRGIYGMSAQAYGRAASAYERAAKILSDAGSPASAQAAIHAARTCYANREQARQAGRMVV